MKYLNNIQVQEIVKLNHGGEGLFRLWDAIIEYYPQIKYNDCIDEFIELIKTLLDERIIELVGTFDKSENIWRGDTNELLSKLRNWLSKEVFWDYKSEASIKMYSFDYPFIKWIKGYPTDIK